MKNQHRHTYYAEKYRDILSLYYFKKNTIWLSDKQWSFLLNNWLDLILKEAKTNISWKMFYKKHKLRLKLIQPPEGI